MEQVQHNISAKTGSEIVSPRARGRFAGVRIRLLLVAFAFCAYVSSFIFLENMYGTGGPTAIVLLVAAVSWFFGFVPGVLAAFLVFPLNFLMYVIIGAEAPEAMLGGAGVAGMIALLLIGAALGRLRDLGRRLTAELAERERTEEALRASRQAAVEANRFRSRFFTNITHEFRTPLTLAIGPLEGLSRGEFGPIGPDMQEQISVALRNSRHLLKLVNQLLDFSMVESGSTNLFWEKKDLGAIASAVLDAFSVIAAKKKISVAVDAEGSLPAVPIHAASLEKALFNLLGNAFKFTPEGGTIRVELGRAPASIPEDETVVTHAVEQALSLETHIRLCIRDTGIGIRPEHLRTVFERFKQSGENLALERGGSGIGLAHTRELIENMHGTITVKSEPGAGSQFCVYLPLEKPEVGLSVADAAGLPMQELTLNADVETAALASEESVLLCSITGSRPLLLIVDDNRDVLRYIAGIVRSEYDYVAAENGREALRLLEQHVPELIISDIMMPDMDGYELLQQLKNNERWRAIPFIFLTAKADVDMRVEGLESGADDYIPKPFNSLELLARVKAVLRLRTLQRQTNQQKQEIVELTQRLNSTPTYGSIVGNSPAMRAVYQLIESIKHSDSHVLISGETGTGKELVARAIHSVSNRSQGPFIMVNCGAIPSTLMESEFFGHVKGAFTGAVRDSRGLFKEADGGTLFLDEIGEMSLDMQVKLLRVLERGEFMRVGSSTVSRVDARIIVATNKDLKDEVLSGNFREDLYFRIHIIPIHMPPLRKRREDIPLLIEHFLDEYAKKHGTPPHVLSQKDMVFFMQYSYPGNVRELQNMLERVCLMGCSAEEFAVVRSQSGSRLFDLPDDMSGLLNSEDPLREARARVEKDIIVRALEMHNNNHSRAAGTLKISRAALYKKIKQHALKDGQV